MYTHGILVVFIVLLAKCLKRLTDARTPHALVHMMAVHTAFDYKLVTRGSSCTWSLAMFTFIDFTVLFFREAKWPSTSFSHAKTRAAYCMDIRITISFLAVQID